MNATQQRIMDQIRSGRHAQAEPALRRMVQKDPGDAVANHLLAAVLLQLGKPEQALYFAERSVASFAAEPSFYDVLGTVLAALSRNDEAAGAFRRAVDLDPTLASAWNGLGSALMQAGDHDASCEALLRAHELARGAGAINPSFLANTTAALGNAWRVGEAITLLREGLDEHPGHKDLRLQLASMLNYASGVDAGTLRREHELLGLALRAPGLSAPAAREPSTPLRVGLLSPDFRSHSVARFLAPILLHAKDAGLRLFCYASVREPDSTTARFRALPLDWRDVAALDDAAAARLIRADDLDILLDLAGHTAGSRVSVLAWRPSRVQATYLGYPNTTGLPEVDFRLVDSRTDPAGSEAHGVERLARLDPCFLCYEPPDDSVTRAADAATISRPAGPRFASFNTLNKVSAATLDGWSSILKRVPDSTLLLKAMSLKGRLVRERVLREFESRGISPNRLSLHAHTASAAEHLALYRGVDVALDPFPYAGTTTTCEALWMGTPVITLAGDRHASRVGVSLLHAAGVPELIADSVESYAALAASLALDASRLAGYRATLRQSLLSGPLGDAPAFVRRFAALLRTLVSSPAEPRA